MFQLVYPFAEFPQEVLRLILAQHKQKKEQRDGGKAVLPPFQIAVRPARDAQTFCHFILCQIPAFPKRIHIFCEKISG